MSFTPTARVWRVVALVLALAGADAVASTYSSFSNTLEEPTHLAAGLQWLSAHRYDEDVAQPPLGRIAAAVGPYFEGARSLGSRVPAAEGLRMLGAGTHYRSTLNTARLGELPFFLLLCGLAWAWGRRLSDERGGAIAVLLVASNPNVIAHAGLATPAIAIAATVTAALLAFVWWLESPGPLSSLALGIAIGLACATDFGTLAYLGLALPATWTLRRAASGRAPVWSEGPRWRAPLAALATFGSAALVVWAVYRFDFGPVVDGSWLRLPAPGWFQGLATYVRKDPRTYPAFLFGALSDYGWWYYYPVALLVKTPLPLMLLSVIGVAAASADLVRRGRWQTLAPLCGVAAVLTIAAFRGDDSGVGRVLAVFPLLAVTGSYGAVALWERGARRVPALRFCRIAVAATLGAAVLVPMRAHPDHLAYFNPFAGDNPERLLVAGNLDLGQDLYRLGAVMKRMHIETLHLAYFGSAPFDAAGVRNTRLLRPMDRPRGWIAASETMLAGVGGDGAYEWLNELRPVGRVGTSIVLFYVPPIPPIKFVPTRSIR